MLPRRRDRFLRALGVALIAFGGCALLTAVVAGPLDVRSLEDALAAHLPVRAMLAFAGVVAAILGWVLRGSGTPG
jgi:hypothetical protein